MMLFRLRSCRAMSSLLISCRQEQQLSHAELTDQTEKLVKGAWSCSARCLLRPKITQSQFVLSCCIINMQYLP